jgi:actin-related protein
MQTAIVLELGTSSVTVGFSGADVAASNFPNVVFGSGEDAVVGSTAEPAARQARRRELERDNAERPGQQCPRTVPRTMQTTRLDHPVECGQIRDWDQIECVFKHAFEETKAGDLKHHPVLISQGSPHATQQSREKLCELMFEQFGVPQYYEGDSQVLSLSLFALRLISMPMMRNR